MLMRQSIAFLTPLQLATAILNASSGEETGSADAIDVLNDADFGGGDGEKMPSSTPVAQPVLNASIIRGVTRPSNASNNSSQQKTASNTLSPTVSAAAHKPVIAIPQQSNMKSTSQSPSKSSVETPRFATAAGVSGDAKHTPVIINSPVSLAKSPVRSSVISQPSAGLVAGRGDDVAKRSPASPSGTGLVNKHRYLMVFTVRI
jgi:hypothetical protein